MDAVGASCDTPRRLYGVDFPPQLRPRHVGAAAATGKPCGRGRLPLVDGRPASLPHSVLYPQGRLTDGAPLADKAEDAHLVYQVTVMAARTDQAEWLADRVRQAVLGRTSSGEWVSPIRVQAWTCGRGSCSSMTAWIPARPTAAS